MGTKRLRLPYAWYEFDTKDIVLFRKNPNIMQTLNHEFMHALLHDMEGLQASRAWDKIDIILYNLRYSGL